ncbi:hypothetical protein V5O46_11330 [Streptomyces sp. C6-003]
MHDIAADPGPHYDWIGTGRAGGRRDEFLAVYDEFLAVYHDTRRLVRRSTTTSGSPTPRT